jgi:hypothetical protein
VAVGVPVAVAARQKGLSRSSLRRFLADAPPVAENPSSRSVVNQ